MIQFGEEEKRDIAKFRSWRHLVKLKPKKYKIGWRRVRHGRIASEIAIYRKEWLSAWVVIDSFRLFKI